MQVHSSDNSPLSMASSPSSKLLFSATILITISIYTSLAQSSNNGIVLPGSIISANETGIPWLSPSGDFAFGFQKVEGTADRYYLCVWFNRLPDQTIAWYLSTVDPVPKGSTATLDSQSGVALRDPGGNSIWNASTSVQKTDHGYMNDTGNFVTTSSDNNLLWQTFYLAIETILPGQGLIYGSVLQSRTSYSNPYAPIYYLVFQQIGDFTLSTNKVATATAEADLGIYYNSHTSDPVNASNSAYVLNLEPNGYLSVTRNNKKTIPISPTAGPSALENFYKATINTDGVFALSYHPRNFTISPGWTDVWSVPKNVCLSNNGSGVCGLDSLCTLVNQRPVCKCRPQQMVETSPVIEWKTNKKGLLVTVLYVLLGSSVFVNILLSGAIASLGFYSALHRKKESSFSSSQTFPETNTRCFTYTELEEATDGFKDEAGRGSFGIVYRGVLQSGSRASIAVKKLDRVVKDAEKEFRAEVNTIGQTHHKNLVQLIGFCDQKQHRLLVYEYMSNGTLADLLFQSLKPSWNLRTQIAIGLSRAITYLHEECKTQIIHCDIKPQNILLDENFNAKISDFGLAKLLVMNQSRTLTNIRGTRGYVAPEWFRNKQVTAKVDVYSFGVMLLEIICCKKNIENVEEANEDGMIILVDWVWDCFQENRLDTLIDGDLEALADWKTMERFVMVGIWCVQEDANLRPTMRKVNLMLEGIVEVSLPPCPDLFNFVS